MKLLTKTRHRGLAALAAAAVAVTGLSQVTAYGATKITLTEEDYFNTPGQISALAAYTKQFEASHPGVTNKATVRTLRQSGHQAPDAGDW